MLPDMNSIPVQLQLHSHHLQSHAIDANDSTNPSHFLPFAFLQSSQPNHRGEIFECVKSCCTAGSASPRHFQKFLKCKAFYQEISSSLNQSVPEQGTAITGIPPKLKSSQQRKGPLKYSSSKTKPVW